MAKKNKLITAANFRDFDWNKAKLFYHIAKCGSYAKAARLAGTDQPSLTRQIQSLEKQVGSPLLIRKAGFGVVLTRKGEELLEKVAPFFLEMRGFCGNNHVEIGEGNKRKIRIATTNALAAYVIGDLILDYSNHHPQLTFEIIGDDHTIDVILNDVDIAIRPYDSQGQGVQQEPLFTLEKKLFTSREYLEKYSEPKTVDDLKNHHLIVNSFNPEQYPFADILWILRLGMPEGKFHIPSFISNSLEVAISAAKKGKGIIGTYEEMSILREANLINVLPHVKGKEIKVYFICPDYLKEDSDIIGIKNYLYTSITSLLVTHKKGY